MQSALCIIRPPPLHQQICINVTCIFRVEHNINTASEPTFPQIPTSITLLPITCIYNGNNILQFMLWLQQNHVPHAELRFRGCRVPGGHDAGRAGHQHRCPGAVLRQHDTRARCRRTIGATTVRDPRVQQRRQGGRFAEGVDRGIDGRRHVQGLPAAGACCRWPQQHGSGRRVYHRLSGEVREDAEVWRQPEGNIDETRLQLQRTGIIMRVFVVVVGPYRVPSPMRPLLCRRKR